MNVYGSVDQLLVGQCSLLSVRVDLPQTHTACCLLRASNPQFGASLDALAGRTNGGSFPVGAAHPLPRRTLLMRLPPGAQAYQGEASFVLVKGLA